MGAMMISKERAYRPFGITLLSERLMRRQPSCTRPAPLRVTRTAAMSLKRRHSSPTRPSALRTAAMPVSMLVMS